MSPASPFIAVDREDKWSRELIGDDKLGTEAQFLDGKGQDGSDASRQTVKGRMTSHLEQASNHQWLKAKSGVPTTSTLSVGIPQGDTDRSTSSSIHAAINAQSSRDDIVGNTDGSSAPSKNKPQARRHRSKTCSGDSGANLDAVPSPPADLSMTQASEMLQTNAMRLAYTWETQPPMASSVGAGARDQSISDSETTQRHGDGTSSSPQSRGTATSPSALTELFLSSSTDPLANATFHRQINPTTFSVQTSSTSGFAPWLEDDATALPGLSSDPTDMTSRDHRAAAINSQKFANLPPRPSLNFSGAAGFTNDPFSDGRLQSKPNARNAYSSATFGSSTFKTGDWVCVSPTCNFHNYSRNSFCVACGTRKPASPSTRSNMSLPASSSSTALSSGPTTATSLHIPRSIVPSFYPVGERGMGASPRSSTLASQYGPADVENISAAAFGFQTSIQGPSPRAAVDDVRAAHAVQLCNGFGNALDATHSLSPSLPMQKELPFGLGTHLGDPTVANSNDAVYRSTQGSINLPSPPSPGSNPSGAFVNALSHLPSLANRASDSGSRTPSSTPVLSTAAKLASLGVSLGAGVNPVTKSSESRTDVSQENPPIVNTGNSGPMCVQPGDWICTDCSFINWRRRKVCMRCYPFVEGNEVATSLAEGAMLAAHIAAGANHNPAALESLANARDKRNPERSTRASSYNSFSPGSPYTGGGGRSIPHDVRVASIASPRRSDAAFAEPVSRNGSFSTFHKIANVNDLGQQLSGLHLGSPHVGSSSPSTMILSVSQGSTSASLPVSIATRIPMSYTEDVRHCSHPSSLANGPSAATSIHDIWSYPAFLTRKSQDDQAIHVTQSEDKPKPVGTRSGSGGEQRSPTKSIT